MQFSIPLAVAALCFSFATVPKGSQGAILIQNEPAAQTLGEYSNRGTESWPGRIETGQSFYTERDMRFRRITWIGHYEDDRGLTVPSIEQAAPDNGGTIDFEIAIWHDSIDPRYVLEPLPVHQVTIEATYELLPEYPLSTYRFEAVLETPLLINRIPWGSHYISVVETDPNSHDSFVWNDSALTEWKRLSRKTNYLGAWFTRGKNQAGQALTVYGEFIPEPSSIALSGLPLLSLAALRRRK